MAEAAESVDQQQARPANDAIRPANRRAPPMARKSHAQKIARVVSRPVKDRHERAEVRVHIYNHLLNLMDAHARDRARLKSLNRKLIMMLVVCMLLLGGALTLLIR